MVDIRTLGTASISLDGDRRIGLVGHPDGFALLALLALEGPADREYLRRVVGGGSADAAEFEPATDEALEALLSIIEASLGSGALREADGKVGLDPALAIHIDAARFETALKRGENAAAASVYGGSFLAGLPPPSSPALRRWVETTRRRYAAAFAELDARQRASLERGTAGGPAAAGIFADPLADPPRSRLERFMDRLRARLTYQIAAIYLMAAWAGLQVVDMLVDRNMLGRAAFEASLWLALAGFPVVVLLAWARDEEGVSIGDYPATRGPWPRWIPRSRAGHMLVALAATFLILVSAFLVLRRSLPRPPAAAAPAEPTSLAVLYFDDFSPGQELGPVAGGFTSDLIDLLNEVPSLDVRSLGSVKPYRDGSVPIDSIFGRLNVGAIVEGGLSLSGDTLLARVRLVAASESGPRVLAQARVPGAAGGELDLGMEVAQEVARLLREQLGIEIAGRAVRRQTESNRSWGLVQRALTLKDSADALAFANAAEARRYLEEADSTLMVAQRADPKWYLPVVQRGWVAAQRADLESEFGGSYDPAWAREALRHADRALDLAPGNAGALELRGRVAFGLAEVSRAEEADSLLRTAERDLRAALAAGRGRALAAWTLSLLYRRQSRYEDAFRYAERALQEDYYLSVAPAIVFQLYTLANDMRDAAAADRYCVEGRRRWPEIAAFYVCGLVLLESYGSDTADVTKGWELYDDYVGYSPEQQREGSRRAGLMMMASVAAKVGLADSARSLISVARQPEPLALLTYDEAHAWLLLGEPELALERLEEYVEFRPTRRESLATDWWFEELRGDPRFQTLTADRPEG